MRKFKSSLQVFKKRRNAIQSFDFAFVGVIKSGSVNEHDLTTIQSEFRGYYHVSSAGIQLG